MAGTVVPTLEHPLVSPDTKKTEEVVDLVMLNSAEASVDEPEAEEEAPPAVDVPTATGNEVPARTLSSLIVAVAVLVATSFASSSVWLSSLAANGVGAADPPARTHSSSSVAVAVSVATSFASSSVWLCSLAANGVGAADVAARTDAPLSFPLANTGVAPSDVVTCTGAAWGALARRRRQTTVGRGDWQGCYRVTGRVAAEPVAEESPATPRRATWRGEAVGGGGVTHDAKAVSAVRGGGRGTLGAGKTRTKNAQEGDERKGSA